MQSIIDSDLETGGETYSLHSELPKLSNDTELPCMTLARIVYPLLIHALLALPSVSNWPESIYIGMPLPV